VLFVVAFDDGLGRVEARRKRARHFNSSLAFATLLLPFAPPLTALPLLSELASLMAPMHSGMAARGQVILVKTLLDLYPHHLHLETGGDGL